MKMYKLSEILETAKSFSKTPDANEQMEKILREKESVLLGVPEETVEMISDDSLREAINELTVCAPQLYIAIVSKFKNLGYKSIEK